MYTAKLSRFDLDGDDGGSGPSFFRIHFDSPFSNLFDADSDISAQCRTGTHLSQYGNDTSELLRMEAK
jgi:hypothetical protein